MRITYCISLFFFSFLFIQPVFTQKLLQIEKKGKVATTKIYIGESLFIRTVDHPDYWYEAEIQDILMEAKALVFEDRIIPIKDILSIKRNRKSAMNGAGRAMQYSALIPAAYEVVYGLVEPPIEWRSLALFTGGSFALGSLLRLIPPKQYKIGKKYRLRVLDLTF